MNDKNQMCFVVWSDEIEGRLDPYFYSSTYTVLEKLLKKSKYRLEKLGNLLNEIYRYPTFYNIHFKKNGIICIKTINITKDGQLKPLDSNEYDYIDKEVSDKFPRTILQKDDLILTVRGATIGKIALITEEFEGANINPNLIRISLKKDRIIPKYFWIYFNIIGQKLFLKQVANTAKQTITVPQIKELFVLLPPLSIQNQIVELMESAYKQKKEKEAEAERLLNSVDDYVLDELGIKMPEIKDKICFVIDSDEIENNRMDSYYYQPKFRELENAVENGKYNTIKINEKLEILTELEDISKYDFIKYIDLASINKDLGIVENYKELKYSEAPSRAKQKAQKGDLLLSSLQGSLKSIAVVEDNFDNIIVSTGFYVIRKSENYNNYYLWSIFRNSIYQILLNRITTGAIMSAINRKDLENLKIPLPPLTIQNKIAKEVKSRIEKAKKLKEEAQQIIENAKKEVEKIILGE